MASDLTEQAIFISAKLSAIILYSDLIMIDMLSDNRTSYFLLVPN